MALLHISLATLPAGGKVPSDPHFQLPPFSLKAAQFQLFLLVPLPFGVQYAEISLTVSYRRKKEVDFETVHCNSCHPTAAIWVISQMQSSLHFAPYHPGSFSIHKCSPSVGVRYLFLYSCCFLFSPHLFYCSFLPND